MSGLIVNQYVLPVLMGLVMVGLGYLDAKAFNEDRSNTTYLKLFLGAALITWLTHYLLVGKSFGVTGGSFVSSPVEQMRHPGRSVDPRIPRF